MRNKRKIKQKIYVIDRYNQGKNTVLYHIQELDKQEDYVILKKRITETQRKYEEVFKTLNVGTNNWEVVNSSHVISVMAEPAYKSVDKKSKSDKNTNLRAVIGRVIENLYKKDLERIERSYYV